tara:strand:+ start:451 stop:693 length:243 start_codon:yes stop_codon:yes gene_type:complete
MSVIAMNLKEDSCRDLDMVPLDENQRDSIIGKILKIGNRHKKEVASNIMEELMDLRKKGYDVDAYFLVLRNFVQRYGVKA